MTGHRRDRGAGSPAARAAVLLALVAGALVAGVAVPGGGQLAARLTGDAPAPPSPSSSSSPPPPRTSDRVLRPTAGASMGPCPRGYGWTPELPGVCVSPVPDVLRRMPTTTVAPPSSRARTTTTTPPTTTTR